MRTQIKVGDSGYVKLAFDDAITGARHERTYFVPAGGGYVRRADEPNYPQVCEGLSGTGHTLMAMRDTLPAVIRREYKRMRRAERALNQ